MALTMTVEAAMARIAGRVEAGALCWRCGLGHGDLHPVAGSAGRVEHVDDPGCAVLRGLLIQVRDDLAALHDDLAAVQAVAL